MVPMGIDYGLTSPSHATDKSTELMLRKLGPLLNESLSELPDSCWLDLAKRNGFLQHIPCMLYGLIVSSVSVTEKKTCPKKTCVVFVQYMCSRYRIVMEALCARALSSIRMKSGPIAPAYGRT